MAHLEGSHAQRVQLHHLPVAVLGDVHGETPAHAGRAGKQGVHGPGQPVTSASGPGNGQVPGAVTELAVEDEEREPAEMIAVQVADHDGADHVGIQVLQAQRGQAGRSAVQQGVRLAGGMVGHGDAGLEPAAGAERVPAARDDHMHVPVLQPARPACLLAASPGGVAGILFNTHYRLAIMIRWMRASRASW